MYKEKEGKWSSEGKIKFPPLTSTIGVAIHYPLNYFVISDIDNNQLLFFNQTARDLICSFKPFLLLLLLLLPHIFFNAHTE